MSERLSTPRFDPYTMERDSGLGKVALTVEKLDQCSTIIGSVVVVFIRSQSGQLRVVQDMYNTDTVPLPLNHPLLVRAQMFAESVLSDIALRSDPEAALRWQRTFGTLMSDAETEAASLIAEDDVRAGKERE